MDAIVDDLALSIIILCDPHSLSNLSLINMRYHGLLHGNSVLMLLSNRHDFKFESFEEYQLFCELKYLVPQASKHYDMNYYKLSIDEFNSLPSNDEILETFGSPYPPDFEYCDGVLDVILRCLYEEEAHITGNLVSNNPTVKEIQEVYGSTSEDTYFRYIVRHCPNIKIVIQYWNKYNDKLITDDEDDGEYLFRELFNECISSIYCIERFHWFRSIDSIRAHDYLPMVEIPHPYIVHYVINHFSADSERYVFDNGFILSQDELMTISNNYKHSERVDRLVQKMLI